MQIHRQTGCMLELSGRKQAPVFSISSFQNIHFLHYTIQFFGSEALFSYQYAVTTCNGEVTIYFMVETPMINNFA